MMFLIFCILLNSVLSSDDKPNSRVHYRSTNSIVAECEFDMLEKLPIEKSVKREIETHIVYPTYESSPVQKFRRYLFYGYGLEIMKETTKTIACQNNWLFHQIDASTFIIKFLHGEETSLKNIFEMAVYESQKQNTPFVFLVNEIDQIFGNSKENFELLQKVRNWLLESFAKIESPNFEMSSGQKNHDFILIFNSKHPTMIDEAFLQRLSQKSIFFDFQTLKQFKFSLALRILEVDYKINSFSNFEDHPKDPNSKYNEKYMSTYSHNYDSSSPNYNYKSENYFDKFQKQRLKQFSQKIPFDNENTYRPEPIIFPMKRIDLDPENPQKANLKESMPYSENPNESQKNFFSSSNTKNQQFAGPNPQNVPYKNFNPQEVSPIQNDKYDKDSRIYSHFPIGPMRDSFNSKNVDENTFTMGGGSEMPFHSDIPSSLGYRNQNPYDMLKNKLKNSKYSSFLQYYGDDSSSRYDDNYAFNRGYDGGYGIHDHETQQNLCDFPPTEDVEIIKKDSLEFGISRRPDEVSNEKDREAYAELFMTDNILFVRGKTVCLKFDNDFEDFIKDHCLAWKYNDPDQENYYYNRAGFTYEDAKSIVKLTLNKFLNIKAVKNETSEYEKQPDYFSDRERGENHYENYGINPDRFSQQDRERKWIENEFIFTASSLKVTLLNYIPISTLEEANSILKWSSMHQYIRAHIQYLTSKLSEAFLVPQNKKKSLRMMKKSKYDFSENNENGLWSTKEGTNPKTYLSDYELPQPEQEVKSESLANTLSSLDSKISALDSKVDSFEGSDSSEDASVFMDKKKLLSFITNLKRNMRKKEKLKYWQKLTKLKGDLEEIRVETDKDNVDKKSLISKLAAIEKTLKEIRKMQFSEEETETPEKLTNDVKEALEEIDANSNFGSNIENENRQRMNNNFVNLPQMPYVTSSQINFAPQYSVPNIPVLMSLGAPVQQYENVRIQ